MMKRELMAGVSGAYSTVPSTVRTSITSSAQCR